MKTVKNLQICPQQIFVRPEFALNFCYTYFNWIFHPQGVTFWQFFAVRAHIRIFLAFRICINFYPILEIELARPNLPPKIWGHSQGKKLSIFAIFCGSKPDTFYILSICDLKESSEPILPLWGHERHSKPIRGGKGGAPPSGGPKGHPPPGGKMHPTP